MYVVQEEAMNSNDVRKRAEARIQRKHQKKHKTKKTEIYDYLVQLLSPQSAAQYDEQNHLNALETVGKKAKKNEKNKHKHEEYQYMLKVLSQHASGQREAQRPRPELADNQSNINQVSQENSELQRKVQRLETENAELRDEQRKLQQTNQEFAANQPNVAHFTQENSRLQNEVQRLKQELDVKKGALQNVERRQQGEENTMEEKRKLEEENHTLHKQMKEQDRKVNEFQQQMEEQDRKIRQIQKQNKALEHDKDRLEDELYPLRREVKDQRMKIERLKTELDVRKAATVSQPERQPERQAPRGMKIILPQESYDDPRVRPVWEQLLILFRKHQIEVHTEMKGGRDIKAEDGITILPCICASRVGSDILATLDKAKLRADIRLVIIIFNHLAPHCNTIRVKTRDRISDRYVLERCRLMVDAVFWEGKMSNCKVNDELILELKEVLKPK